MVSEAVAVRQLAISFSSEVIFWVAEIFMLPPARAISFSSEVIFIFHIPLRFFLNGRTLSPRNGERPELDAPAFQLDPPDRVDGPAFRENDTLKRVVPSREDGQSE